MTALSPWLKKAFFRTLNGGIFADTFAKKDPDFFPLTGTHIFTGFQGSGKTISVVRLVQKLQQQYPKSILISNVDLKKLQARRFTNVHELKNQAEAIKLLNDGSYLAFNDVEQLLLALTEINNDKYGVIYLIDEMHIYFNSLGSKNIPLEVFTEIAQQRKQRKLILGCSQVFMRLAKPFREQCSSMVMCSTHLFSMFTVLRLYDPSLLNIDDMGRLHGDCLKLSWFWQSRELRESYDTFQKVYSLVDGATAELQDMSPSDYQFNRKFRKRTK